MKYFRVHARQISISRMNAPKMRVHFSVDFSMQVCSVRVGEELIEGVPLAALRLPPLLCSEVEGLGAGAVIDYSRFVTFQVGDALDME